MDSHDTVKTIHSSSCFITETVDLREERERERDLARLDPLILNFFSTIVSWECILGLSLTIQLEQSQQFNFCIFRDLFLNLSIKVKVKIGCTFFSVGFCQPHFCSKIIRKAGISVNVVLYVNSPYVLVIRLTISITSFD